MAFEAIESGGVEEFLAQLRTELKQGRYQPQRNRRKEIPKDGSKVRILGIPRIRDRVVQGACKLILEPIFEADFQPGSYGYRPKRTAHEAVERAAQAIVVRKTRVIDIDLAAYLECSLAAEIEATARAENLLPQLGRVTAPLLARVSELDCRNRSAEQPANCSRHPP